MGIGIVVDDHDWAIHINEIQIKIVAGHRKPSTPIKVEYYLNQFEFVWFQK